VKHLASPDFWVAYRKLPEEIRRIADKNFELMKVDPRHPSLRLKKIGPLWSVRVGLQWRALAKERQEGLIWVWVGHHSEYDRWLKAQ
jgi:hypothetical protein